MHVIIFVAVDQLGSISLRAFRPARTGVYPFHPWAFKVAMALRIPMKRLVCISK